LLFVFVLLSSLIFNCYDPTEPDTTPPTVIITYPIDGATVSEKVLITCVATDDKGIKKVTLWVDGKPFDGVEDQTEPYELYWNTIPYTNNSSHTITVRAFDTSDNATDSEPIVLIVDNSSACPTKINFKSIYYQNGSFIITWFSSPDADFYSYTLYQAFSADMSDKSEIFATTNVDDTTFTVSNVSVDELRYYQISVQDSMGLITWSAILSGSSQDLIAYYAFNGNVNDESGHEHHGTKYGVSFSQDRFGNLNSAASFNGNDWIELPDDIRFKPFTPVSVAFWLRTEQASRFDFIDQRIGSWSPDNYNFGIIFNYDIDVRKRLVFVYPMYNPYREIEFPIFEELSNNNWQHFVFIKDTILNKLLIYINGALFSEEILPDVNFSINGKFLIGKNYLNNYHYIGLLDDLYVFDRVLSQAEINELYF